MNQPSISMMSKWDIRFLELAEHIGSWSKDPSSKIGCVIVDKCRRIVGSGYNGFPRGVSDSPELYDDRKVKYSRVVHAEVNAISTVSLQLQLTESTLYCTHCPCNDCAKLIIQSQIGSVVFYNQHSIRYEYEEGISMMHEAGIKLKEYSKP